MSGITEAIAAVHDLINAHPVAAFVSACVCLALALMVHAKRKSPEAE